MELYTLMSPHPSYAYNHTYTYLQLDAEELRVLVHPVWVDLQAPHVPAQQERLGFHDYIRSADACAFWLLVLLLKAQVVEFAHVGASQTCRLLGFFRPRVANVFWHSRTWISFGNGQVGQAVAACQGHVAQVTLL